MNSRRKKKCSKLCPGEKTAFIESEIGNLPGESQLMNNFLNISDQQQQFYYEDEDEAEEEANCERCLMNSS